MSIIASSTERHSAQIAEAPVVSSYQITIRPGGNTHQYWLNIWRYRGLLKALAWRDLSVRYKQAAIGVAWALLRPFLTMVIFTVIFSELAGLHAGGSAPYALMVFAGMLPWTLFSGALSDASASLVSNSNLISKVYFPRLIVPMASVSVALVDFLISSTILLAVMLYYAYMPSPRILLLPVFAVIALLASLGPALWLAALNVKYRDFRYVIPFLLQIGLYVSPVGFSLHIVPSQWRLAYALNPMVGVIEGFRWCILGGDHPIRLADLALGVGVTAIFLWLGYRQFQRLEAGFADHV
jgi:lipopolysaccharide transport system permease protein